MKKTITFFMACFFCLIPLSAKQKMFQIKGPESSYNQIRVVNETSYGDFKCRLVLLNKRANGRITKKGYYGVYHLKGYGDIDTCTSSVRRGSYIGIEMEKDFPCEVNFDVTYRDYPFFDIVLIHLYDGEKKTRNTNYDDDYDDDDDDFLIESSSKDDDDSSTKDNKIDGIETSEKKSTEKKDDETNSDQTTTV